MPTPPLSIEDMKATLDLVRVHGSSTAAAAASGINKKTFDTRYQKAKIAVRCGIIASPPIPEIARPPLGFAVTRNGGQYDGDGNLLRQYVSTKRDSGETFEVPSGHVVKGESALVDADGRVMQRWVKTVQGVAQDGLMEGLRAAFASYDGKAGVIPEPANEDADLLTIYPLPDLHLGMMSWGKETGEDYDLDIATDLAIKSLTTLVEQSRPSKHAVLLGLGDYFHTDDQRNVTPGSGHQLDVDSRWAKIFASGAKLATAMVDIIAKKHSQIEVVFKQGNHDINSAMCLTVALSLFYSSNPRISVNTDPGIAWYRRFGSCLIGATHGHTIKMANMPMLMAADRAEDWGLTRHRSMFSGHIHHESAKEIGGVRVESLQAPAARDAWNAASGYRSGRSLSAITFHTEDGEIGRHRVNVAQPVKRAA